jgi:hypothetical protein
MLARARHRSAADCCLLLLPRAHRCLVGAHCHEHHQQIVAGRGRRCLAAAHAPDTCCRPGPAVVRPLPKACCRTQRLLLTRTTPPSQRLLWYPTLASAQGPPPYGCCPGPQQLLLAGAVAVYAANACYRTGPAAVRPLPADSCRTQQMPLARPAAVPTLPAASCRTQQMPLARPAAVRPWTEAYCRTQQKLLAKARHCPPWTEACCRTQQLLLARARRRPDAARRQLSHPTNAVGQARCWPAVD